MKVIESRKKYYAVSICVIVLGLLFMIINGVYGKGAFNQDIEFTGGSRLQVDVKQAFSNTLKSEIEVIAKEVTGNENIRVTSSGTTSVIISMPHTSTEARQSLFTALKEKYNLTETDLQYDTDFSPTISQDIKIGAVKAVLVGTILILIYISFRFKDYKFGMSAVIALLHDVCVMLAVYAIFRVPLNNSFIAAILTIVGYSINDTIIVFDRIIALLHDVCVMLAVYAIFRVPLNNSFIAAILTIVGYSINDTIIVFDRIRENKVKRGLKEHQVVPLDLVDNSISQTIGRSVSTSFTTIVIVVLLFFIGTSTVKEFAFPLIIGVAAGTYSSIFIASPIWYDLTHKHAKKTLSKK